MQAELEAMFENEEAVRRRRKSPSGGVRDGLFVTWRRAKK